MAQSLSCHSNINLTMNVYTDVVLEDQAVAVELLPELPALLPLPASTPGSGIFHHLARIGSRAASKDAKKSQSM